MDKNHAFWPFIVAISLAYSTASRAQDIKSIENTGLVFTGPGVTNLLQLDFIAPADGFAHATATGYCNVNPISNVQWAYTIGTSATEGWNFPRPLVWLASGTSFIQFPIAVDRVFSVLAGPNSVFLNVHNVLGTALSSCGAVLTVTFTSSQLQ